MKRHMILIEIFVIRHCILKYEVMEHWPLISIMAAQINFRNQWLHRVSISHSHYKVFLPHSLEPQTSQQRVQWVMLSIWSVIRNSYSEWPSIASVALFEHVGFMSCSSPWRKRDPRGRPLKMIAAGISASCSTTLCRVCHRFMWPGLEPCLLMWLARILWKKEQKQSLHLKLSLSRIYITRT